VYVARIRCTCADLLAVGLSVTDDEAVPALLAGLPAAYGMVVTVIESSEEELTFQAVVTKLLNTEARVVREETAEAHVAAPPRSASSYPSNVHLHGLPTTHDTVVQFTTQPESSRIHTTS
jgi:hypothetical protein